VRARATWPGTSGDEEFLFIHTLDVYNINGAAGIQICVDVATDDRRRRPRKKIQAASVRAE
jgi:hypothetical protein